MSSPAGPSVDHDDTVTNIGGGIPGDAAVAGDAPLPQPSWTGAHPPRAREVGKRELVNKYMYIYIYNPFFVIFLGGGGAEPEW